MGIAILAQNTLLAQNTTGPEFGKASPVGLVIIALLLVGTALLVRSMNGHMKKLPSSFEPSDPTPDQAADEGTDRGGIGPDPRG
ncbi:hypothetical protein HQ609_07930 [Rhodococcus corynebacterioides]|nr:hypothetical protein [Rhodococcus corynebacterioides]